MDQSTVFSTIPTQFDPIQVFKEQVARAQASAAARNLRRVTDTKSGWEQQRNVAQLNVDKDLPLPSPVYYPAPLKEVVDDLGNTTWVTFDDLNPPPVPTKTEPGQGVGVPIFTQAALKDAAMLAALGRIEAKLDQLLAK